jgi:hypothetical protein
VFQATHGLIEDRCSIGEIRSDVARKSGAASTTAGKDRTAFKIPDRARQADFHFVYDIEL